MSEADHRKAVDRIKRKNRGDGVLDSLPEISVEPQKKRDTWGAYRDDLDNLYLEEKSSTHLSELLENVSLSARNAEGGLKSKLSALLSKASRPFSRIFAYDLYRKVSLQEAYNSKSALLIQRLLDLDKKSNDIIANKIEQMEQKYDELIGEIVHKYLVNFTRDLVSRMDILYRRLDENFISHDMELGKINSEIEYFLSVTERLKSEMQDLKGILGAQRRSFEDIFAGASKLQGSGKSTEPPSLGRLKDIDYVIFENRFRGSSDLIRERQRKYTGFFEGCKTVLDLACGRGEFLELMKERGISAEGVDINKEMIDICLGKGLKVSEADALDFTKDKKEKFDGIFCSNFVEHLDFPQLRELIRGCARSLKENGVIVIETVNPESLNVFGSAFYLDMTHIRPIHPLGLEAFLESNGFSETKIMRTTPTVEDERLEEAGIEDRMSPEVRDTLKAVNRNFGKLNNLLFGYQEYGIAARKIKK